jgi:hypothetical protein
MNHTYDQTCEACLKEMFKRVGLTYPNKITKQKDWYMKKCWTTKEEDDFRDWMKKYLKKKHRWSATTIRKEIGMFLLMWGWKVSEKEGSITDKKEIKNESV